MKRFLKILRNAILIVISIVLLLIILINYTPFQNFLVSKTTSLLSSKLKTKVQLKHVRLDLLNHILLQGIFIEDKAGDTLVYAGEVQVRITDWFIFKEKPVLHYLSIQDAFIHLYRTPDASSWNYDFIVDALAGKNNNTHDTSAANFDFNLHKIELEQVRFHMDDSWGGENLDFDVGNMDVSVDNTDIKHKVLDIQEISFEHSNVMVNEFHKSLLDTIKHLNTLSDFSPFNPDKWGINIKKVSLTNCLFKLKDVGKPRFDDTAVFDENNMVIKNININVSNIRIVGDTVHGDLNQLSANERCGIVIKKMKSKITVSPVASVCENLILETNYSKVQNYYAMRYAHFPAFLNFIDSVKMEGSLKDAFIDSRDIAYFAPQLREFPFQVKAKGEMNGTVSGFIAQRVELSDGINTIAGNIKIQGLPDIDKTIFNYTDGKLHTSGQGILKYTPGLKNNPNLNLNEVTTLDFTGSFDGFLQNFNIKGIVISNLGKVTTDLYMNLPGFEPGKSVYSGTINTEDLQIGKLLNLPNFGEITLNEIYSGKSFISDSAELNVDGTISSFTIYGYNYHNINTKGVLAQKQFTGNLMISDPNLALDFDGYIDYSKTNVVVNSKAHLLNANFKALNLTADSFTASSDFDLNFHGDDIDNFLGYARLYNIDMKRNRHRLDLDSISISSTYSNGNKQLDVASNDLAGYIKGDFQLSKLPSSIQYYLSRYIPNYIPEPNKSAPPQNFDFSIKTNDIDSLLAVTFPVLRGFDDASVSGSFNTSSQKLILNANVPYATIGKFHMTNVTVAADGNLNNLGLNIAMENAAFADSMFSGSLNITTTIGNDLLNFNITTTTPDTSASVKLNGEIKAHKDSLFLKFSPSKFFLGTSEWSVNPGCEITYSNKYLCVQGLNMVSELQKITVYSPSYPYVSSLTINTENLDLGQLGSWAGLASYQPDGRLNGTIQVVDIFNHLVVNSNLKATNVKLGNDTIGTINIIGSYTGDKKLVTLDPQTGIYKDNSSVIASGNISFDSLTNQQLNGKILLTNTPVSWFSTFMSGIMSKLAGNVDGEVEINGSSFKPEINGYLTLNKGFMHLDYLGVNYQVPNSVVHLNNHFITFGETVIYDDLKNKAILTGYFSHNLFKDIKMNLALRSKKIQMVNLNASDNNYFYGNIIGGVDSFILRGPFNNIDMHAYNAVPAAKSHICIPLATSGDFSNYSYITFKTYGKIPEKALRKTKSKMMINIDANLNDLATLSLILDPESGDAINARGDGNIQLLISTNTDMRIVGRYNINEGDYTYTFNTIKELPLKRIFKLSEGSYITFNGPYDAIDVNVDAVYPVKARFYDLLSDAEKGIGNNTGVLTSPSEIADAQAPQMFDVLLHMRDNIKTPQLTFNVKPEEDRSVGSYPYLKLQQMDQVGDRDLFDQVTSLLLLGTFMSSEGFGGSAATAGALNNMSQLVSGLATSQLNNLAGKLLGKNNVNINLKYSQFSYSDIGGTGTTASNADISQLNLDVSKNYLDDRLTVELGSTSDWGKPANTSSASNFNINGDFRLQYRISKGGNMRLNCFRTSDYDVSLDRYIVRSGLGLSWRKSFDNFHDLFSSSNKNKKKDSTEEPTYPADSLYETK